MKVAILHHDIEPQEYYFAELFTARGCNVNFFDIRTVLIEELLDYDLIFNRVYSSVASRDFGVLDKTIKLLKELEERNVKCYNSSLASSVDYNKYELYKVLSQNGVRTPPTIFIDSKEDIKSSVEEAAKLFGFPIIVKRNCGGKSYEVYRVSSKKELISTIKKMFSVAKKEGYKAGFILQKFIQAIGAHDCRICVVNGRFLFAYSRSFVSRNSEDRWLASTSGGSIEGSYHPTPEEIELALKANKSANVIFSESDIIRTSEGPYVIEINPTPGYFINSSEDLERMKIIVDKLIGEEIPVLSIIKENKKSLNTEIEITEDGCYN